MKTPHERLKFLRIKLGMSQEEFGKLIGLKKPGLLWYEKGGGNNQTFLDRFKLEILHEKLGANPEWLLHGTGEMLSEERANNNVLSPERKTHRIELTIDKNVEDVVIILHRQ